MSGSTGRVSGFFHAGVTVSDMEASLAFYRDALGMTVASDDITGGPSAHRIWGMVTQKVRVVFLRVPDSDTLVELFEFYDMERHPASARPCDFGAGHMCLYSEDLDALYERLTGLGFTTRGSEVVTIDKGPHTGAKAVYMKDPDGYHVEIYQRAPRRAPAQ